MTAVRSLEPPALVRQVASIGPALGALMLALLMSELNQGLLATALPTIVGELHGLDQLLWVNTLYILMGIVAMPVLGTLGDRYGRRPVLAVALTVLVAGSVVGGLAESMPVLLAGRAVQGLGGGGLVVLVQAVVADLVPARRRAPVFSVVGAVFAVGAVAGPLVGGVLTESVGWRWGFWLNLPVGVLAIAAALRYVPRRVTQPSGGPVAFDLSGLVSLATAVGSLTLLASWLGPGRGPASGVVAIVAGVAMAAVAGLVAAERRAARPLLPLSLLRRRNVAVSVAAGVVFAVAMFGTVGYLPTYLQMAVGLSPVRAGVMMLALVAGLGIGTVVAAAITSGTGHYRALPVVGALLVAAALVLLSRGEPGGPSAALVVGLALLGLGTGCAWETLVLVVQNSVPAEQTGVATSTNGVVREVGVLLGSAVVGSVLTARLGEGLDQASAGADPLSALTPQAMAALPATAKAAVAVVYTDALTAVFAALVPVALAGAALLLLLHRATLAGRPSPVASGERS